MKAVGGFSYMEVLIALAIFAVLLMAAIPILDQSGRNLEYAQEGYDAHLAAQGIMLAARAALRDGSAAEQAANDSAVRHGAESFAVFINGVFFCGLPTSVNVSLSTVNFDGDVINVIVFDDEGFILGRAVGIVGTHPG